MEFTFQPTSGKLIGYWWFEDSDWVKINFIPMRFRLVRHQTDSLLGRAIALRFFIVPPRSDNLC